jgi:hypothetical protein
VCVRQAPDVGSADQVGRHMHAVLMGLGGHVAFIGVCVCVCVCVGGALAEESGRSWTGPATTESQRGVVQKDALGKEQSRQRKGSCDG